LFGFEAVYFRPKLTVVSKKTPKSDPRIGFGILDSENHENQQKSECSIPLALPGISFFQNTYSLMISGPVDYFLIGHENAGLK
jgi:hypothetical protein